ncbi:MAG: DUF4199 domain-containing protein [Marinoscillum sp.]|uniref:DUF4199 domain-containing protein n=1 Tax=Marinoscillum sp. TaxID=2024838 RepID=UPI0032F26D9E
MEETKNISIKSVAIKYGLISGLIGIIFFLVIDFAGLSGNQSVSWIGILFTAVIMYFAQKEFIKEGDGYMNYGEGLGLGTLMSLVSAVISSIFTYIYVSFVNPQFIENIRQAQVIAMEEEGMSDAQIEQAMKISENFTGPTGLLIFGLIGGVFVGFLISLIISAITKKSRPEFE